MEGQEIKDLSEENHRMDAKYFEKTDNGMKKTSQKSIENYSNLHVNSNGREIETESSVIFENARKLNLKEMC